MRSAISRPIPRAAPVTTTTLSLSIMVLVSCEGLDDAALAEALDLGVPVPGLPEHPVGVLAERGRRRQEPAGALRPFDRNADGLESPALRVILLGDHPAGQNLGILDHVGGVVHRSAEHV